MNKISKLSYCFFLNGERGIEVLKFFNKKKLKILNVFVAKKFLATNILKKIPKGYNYILINNLKQQIILDTLKKTDIALSCGFPLIFNQSTLNLPRIGFLNCHAGILPKYRGGSPLNWQMINCEKMFGISVIKLNHQIDGGDVFSEKKFLIKKNYDINNLHKIANKNFPKMIIKSIKKIIDNKKPKKQKKNRFIWKQRVKNDSKFDFKTKTFKQADRFVRALQDPYPNAFFYFKSIKYEILKVIKSKKKLKAGDIFLKSNSMHLGVKNATLKVKFKACL
jgi:methionyl-tRNA formyltransferase|tara:strand:- start:63 stop:899 length:837 start_codon:yes stop_codon:yes gene_type:complete